MRTGLFALAVLLCLLLSAPVFAGGDIPMMEVPGGMAAVSRLLGHADETPDRFARSVNRILLETIRPDHDWREHEERILLSVYIATVCELEANYGPRIELSPSAGQGRRDFARLANLCGYSVHRERGRRVCIQRGGPEALHRRRATLALDWDLAGEAEKLDSGENVVLEIQRDLTETPLDFASWEAVTGRPVDSDTAFAELARDQRLGLVLEGLRHVTAETRVFLRDGQLSWIYHEASSPFYRYAAHLELRQGKLVVPGGSGAEEAWSELLGIPLNDTAPFIRSLLSTADGRGAYLWQLLSSVPPTVLDQMASAGLDRAPPWPERLERMFHRLGEEEERLAFDRPRAPGFGIGDWDVLGLVFPAGPESWWDRQEPISRIVRASGFAAGCSGQGLLSDTRADLPLLLRAEDRTPMALHTLESLCITDPALLRDYLELVAEMDRRASGRGQSWPAENFQGGVVLLRILAEAGWVGQTFIDDRLRSWVDLHRLAKRPEEAGSAQLQWLAGLLSDLPATSNDAPGRGERERAFIAALIRRRDPQAFHWRGIDYRGERGRDLAAAMAGRLVEQRIPCPDQVVKIAGQLAELTEACRSRDLERSRRIASALGNRISALPYPHFKPSPVERKKILNRLTAIRENRDPGRLGAMARAAEAAARLMGPEIRALLLCPAYLEAMGEADHFLFADRNLIRRHAISSAWGSKDHPVTPWRAATVIPAAHSDHGTHIAGHLTGVPAAMAAVLSLTSDPAAGTTTAFAQLEPAWYENAVTTPWHRVTPELSRFVTAALEAGDGLIRNALESGGTRQALNPVRLIIPSARLQREAERLRVNDDGPSLISLSERFMAGLAVAESGPLTAAVWGIPTPCRKELEKARSLLGDDWRLQVNEAGAPTPAINGRGRSWVGYWPSYETLVRNGPVERLRERQLIDLRLSVIDYLGRHRLPGEVGADLFTDLLFAVPHELLMETARDWEGFLAWTAMLDEESFDERMRKCFASGRYFAQL